MPGASHPGSRRGRGFTLIELIIVIVVLGVLAAAALPRLVDLGRDARIAKLNGALAAARSAAALAHAASRTGGGAHNAPVAMQGQSITMVNHYPTANTAGIAAAAQLNPADGFHFAGGGATAASQLRIQIAAAPVPAQCSFVYQPPPAVGAAPSFTDIQTSGC